MNSTTLKNFLFRVIVALLNKVKESVAASSLYHSLLWHPLPSKFPLPLTPLQNVSAVTF